MLPSSAHALHGGLEGQARRQVVGTDQFYADDDAALDSWLASLQVGELERILNRLAESSAD